MSREFPPQTGDLISVAEIARPQGLRGEVIAALMTDFPERFARMRRAWAFRPGAEDVREVVIERARMHKGRVVLKLAGCDDMTSAEALRGVRLGIERDELTALPPDAYYDFDLVDCDVELPDGEMIGRVRRVDHYGAAPLLVVEAAAQPGREVLIPLASSICTTVNIERKRIVVDPPEGLMDL